MEIIQSILGVDHEGSNLTTVIESPSEHCLGEFQVRLFPNCGTEIAGCSLELEMKYLDSDSLEMYICVLRDRAEGLTDEQLEDVEYEISQKYSENYSTIEVLEHIKEFLGHLNPSTRKVIQQKEAEL